MNVVASLPSIRKRRSWKSSNGLGFWLRWDGEAKPSTLEIGIEEEAYTLALWWELRLSIKKIRVDSRKRREVKGDNLSRSGSHVEVESAIEKPEELLLSDEGTGRQERVMGWEGIADWTQVSAPMGYERRACGSSFSGLKLKGVAKEGAGPEAGPSKSWAFDEDGSLMDGARPIKPTAQELVFERPEVLTHSNKGLGWQERNLGWKGIADQAQAPVIRGVEKSLCGSNAVMGLKLKERVAISAGPEAS